MWWWLLGAVVVLAAAGYLGWLVARVNRLHRRAQAAAAALDAALVRRAAAAAVLADHLGAAGMPVADHHGAAGMPVADHHGATGTPVADHAQDLYATARAALDADPVEREPAENDLTLALRRVPEQLSGPVPGWPAVAAASRRVVLARQVHTDVVRDALAVRRRVLVRLLGLPRRHQEPAYFDIDDPSLGGDTPGSQPVAADPAAPR